MAAIAYEEDGDVKIKILGPGETWIAKDETHHSIIAAKGPYKHLAIQIPSVFQYGFDFKRSLKTPDVISNMLVNLKIIDLIRQKLAELDVDDAVYLYGSITRGAYNDIDVIGKDSVTYKIEQMLKNEYPGIAIDRLNPNDIMGYTLSNMAHFAMEGKVLNGRVYRVDRHTVQVFNNIEVLERSLRKDYPEAETQQLQYQRNPATARSM